MSPACCEWPASYIQKNIDSSIELVIRYFRIVGTESNASESKYSLNGSIFDLLLGPCMNSLWLSQLTTCELLSFKNPTTDMYNAYGSSGTHTAQSIVQSWWTAFKIMYHHRKSGACLCMHLTSYDGNNEEVHVEEFQNLIPHEPPRCYSQAGYSRVMIHDS